MSDIEHQIQIKIDSFVNELGSLVRAAALDAVQSALGGSRGAAARAVAHSASPARAHLPAKHVAKKHVAKAKGRRTGEKRDPAELEKLTSKLREHIHANKGQGIEAIAKGMGRATKELTLSIKKLLAAKSISSQGQKRATRYFPR